MSSTSRTARRKALFERAKTMFTGIVDAISGKKRSTPAYSAAKKTGFNQGWRPQNYSSDAAILPCSDEIKAKTRDAARNNAFIRGSLAKIVNNVVGSSLTVQFQFLNSAGELDEKLNDLLEIRFREWSRRCMMDGGSFTEMAKIILHTIHVDGEILQNDVIDPRVKQGNPYRVQLFENDYLDVDKGCYGIEFDLYGSPTTFHLYESNPSDSIDSLFQLKKKYTGKSIKINADNMRLVRYRTRSSGYRGISELASIISGAYSLDQLQAAELNAMRTAQAFGLIITSASAQDIAAGMGYEGTQEDTETEEREELVSIPAPGGVAYLNPDEKAETLKSERPNSNFVGFVKLLLRYIGSGLQTSYSEVANDYSEGSYSSLRQERLTVERIYRAKQAHLDEVLRLIIQTWLRNEILFVGVPGLNSSSMIRSPENLARFRICFPGFPWIDPAKAITALKFELEHGIKTRSEATAETYGTDWQTNLKQLAREVKLMKQLGVYQIPSESKDSSIDILQAIEEIKEEGGLKNG